MALDVTIVGWRDPKQPGRFKDGACEFRLRLSEAPDSAWKDRLAELARGTELRIGVERDALVFTCDLSEVERMVGRLQEQVAQVNAAIGRAECEAEERAAQHRRGEEDQRRQIMSAVSGIRFETPRPGA